MGSQRVKNKPLERLRRDLGLPPLRKLPLTDKLQGISGAKFGICQGVYARSGNPQEHTNNVIKNLKGLRV